MTIHITDIPNESFNHYKHVLHVDNEFALIEINKDNISESDGLEIAISNHNHLE